MVNVRPRRAPVLVILGWALALAPLFAAPLCAAPVATHRVALGDGLIASYVPEPRPALYLETVPQAGEGLLSFARRLTGDKANAGAIADANGGTRRLLVGVRYRVPFELLLAEHQLRVVRGLFPDDQAVAEGWQHVITAEVPAQSLWHIASWFTGDGERFRELRARNRMADDTLRIGQRLLVPRELLLPAFAAVLPPPPAVAVAAAGAAAGAELAYRSDAAGEYAVYRLRAGEALYSAVVVRFTGRVFADDVNALAAELATLNRIPDVTDMAIGQEVRIPLDLLLPEYLPPGHPRRAEYERGLTESARYSNTVLARRLEGVTVIIDPGHGGQDPGAIADGVWESTYVYDIALRVRARLAATTAARVAVTTSDGDGFRILDRDRLPRSRGHRVLTSPPYPIEDPRQGLHFRWYLANSLYRKALASNGSDAEKVIFLSIHADALHPTIRGAMIYVPAASLTRGTYGKQGSPYTARAEFREQPQVSFSFQHRVRSEGLSRQLAEHLLTSFARHGLGIHPEKPVRDRIIRSRRSRPFVPAVVRYNAVPAKLLVEVCNLSNREDRRLIETRAFRERMARAIVDGILAYYGQAPIGDPSRVAAR